MIRETRRRSNPDGPVQMQAKAPLPPPGYLLLIASTFHARERAPHRTGYKFPARAFIPVRNRETN